MRDSLALIARRLVADADRERSDAGTVPKVNTWVNVCFLCVKLPFFKTKALTPDLSWFTKYSDEI